LERIETRIHNGYKQYKTADGWVFTHRRVAEKVIGREIPKGYEVHHINRNTLDNRPENLSVMTIETHRAIHNTSNDRMKSILDIGSEFMGICISLDAIYISKLAFDLIAIELELSNLALRKHNLEKAIELSHRLGTCSDELEKTILDKQEEILLKEEILISKKEAAQEELSQSSNKIMDKY